MNSYEQLLNQIDAFIRKYYKNLIIKGLLLALIFFLGSLLLVSLLEFIGRFNSSVRVFLLISFILVNLSIFYTFLFIPILKLFSFGRRITHKQAAVIIGQFFPEISDRLLNTIQLNDALHLNQGNYELVQASIQQRSASIATIPFLSGIDFRKNKKYFYYFLPVFIVFLLVFLFYPSVITQGSHRVVHYNREFVEEAPFDFVLKKFNSDVVEGENVELNVQTIGSFVPSKVYIIGSSGKFLMHKDSKVSNSYVFPSISHSFSFRFEANGFLSKEYRVNVVPKSILGQLNAVLHFPSYLQKKNQFVQNAGDLEIPEGTKITWGVKTKNTSIVDFFFNAKKTSFVDSSFNYSKTFTESSDLKILLKNKYNQSIDKLGYKILVVKDNYPSIEVNQQNDTLSASLKYFSGIVRDDYGLKALDFVYTIHSNDKTRSSVNRKRVLLVYGNEFRFDYTFDFIAENIGPKDRIEYYFEVSDNDGVNGSKRTKSDLFSFKFPSLEQLNELRDQKQELVKDNLNQLLSKATKFQNNIEQIQKDALNDKTPSWNIQNQMDQLKTQQQELQNDLNAVQQQMQESIQEKDKLSAVDKELLEKQEMIQDLLDKVMDNELKELLKKLDDLLKNDDKEQLNNKLEKLDTKSESMKKQLDRSIEMLKKLQLNEKIDDIEKELNELAKEQDKLSNDLKEMNKPSENSLNKQKNIDSKFDALKEDIQELQKLNNTLESPMDMLDSKDSENKISDELNKAEDNLEKGNSKKAQKNQENASQEMKNLSKKLNEKQQESNKKDASEDVASVRLLLENLLSISFNQEEILTGFSKVKTTDPSYRKYARNQQTLLDEIKMVEDSLNHLAKRQPKIASFVDKELNEIRSNLSLAMEAIDEHQKRDVSNYLQFVMTGINNLTLLLDESLQQMQKQMQGQGSGSGSCSMPKPGSNGSSGGDLKEQLKKQLESMEKSMKSGQKPGQKPGSSGSPGQLGLSGKEIAKIAAQQAAMRSALEQYRKELNKDGKGSGNTLNSLINAIDQQERDLINRNKKADYIKRQKEIITRLLESENALKERGFDEKRESNSAKDYNSSNLKRNFQYTLPKAKQIDVLHFVDPSYHQYYKDKSTMYFNRIVF